VREAQRLAVKETDNAALAVAIDLGEAVDIHPLRKWEVAQRVAMGFDKLLWNKKLMLYPEVVDVNVSGSDVVLQLDQPLRENGKLYEFETAGSDGRFANAEAIAEGDKIIIKSAVVTPTKVRYAWKNNPARVNAYSKAALPMSPFEMNIGK